MLVWSQLPIIIKKSKTISNVHCEQEGSDRFNYRTQTSFFFFNSFLIHKEIHLKKLNLMIIII